jgi:hypothetical protein
MTERLPNRGGNPRYDAGDGYKYLDPQAGCVIFAVMALATFSATQRSGRYRGISGRGAATANRSFMTLSDRLPVKIDAVRWVYSITSSARNAVAKILDL